MHLGLVIGILAAIVTVAALLLAGLRGGGGFERVVRCRSGHLFTSTVVPGASLKALRLGVVRFQWCPVGRHWTLVRTVDEAGLTPAERETAAAVHDRLP